MRLSVTGRKVTCVIPSKPSPCIQAGGINGGNTSQYFVDTMTSESKEMSSLSKPQYRVPSMAEIAKIPWNGLNVASTFSGCGGSCLGYRMAGFRVLWANEFVPAAQDSYRANHPETILDCRDIRNIKPEEILAVIKMKAGDLDLLDGSPPCQAFSTAGKREKGWGQNKIYEHGAQQKNETLFQEYVRILRGLMPKIFIAENVSGLVKGTCKGMFLEILRDLKASGYYVAARLLDAQWLGVPQVRKRVIFIGVRKDIIDAQTGAPLQPTYPNPLLWRYSVLDALPWLAKAVTRAGGWNGTVSLNRSIPAPTLTGQRTFHEIKIIQQQSSPACGKKQIDLKASLPTVCASDANQFLLMPIEPESDMSKFATGGEWDRMTAEGRNKSDKYFNLVKASLDAPSPTVTGKGAAHEASVCHPTERRKFSIAELRRLCAFPDDFILTGSYGQQRERLGNSVPPVMMFWIARTVRDKVLFAGKEPWPHDPPCLVAGIKA